MTGIQQIVPNADALRDSCPVCGSDGEFSFASRDLMYDKQEKYRYLICRNCKSEYQVPPPNAAQIASFYPEEYDQYAPLKKQKRRSHAKTAVLKYHYGYAHIAAPPMLYRLGFRVLAAIKYKDELPYVVDGRALDIGCGNGRFIRSMNSLGWRCEGVEFSETAVAVCRQAGLKVFHGELEKAGFDNESFDLVTARHLVEHVADPAMLMTEIARILKPGGKAVFETPNNRSFGKKIFGKLWFANEVPRHLVLFNAESLALLAEKNGLRLLYSKTFASPKILLNSWDYLTGNRGKPSRRRKIRRLLARPFAFIASLFNKGDILLAVFEKP
jgi:2-polyprenyl-3-methyl-5-hydroxy-6-metoxy-1,4-benzoquinol methylase